MVYFKLSLLLISVWAGIILLQNVLQNDTLATDGVGWQWTQNSFTGQLDWGISLIWVNSSDRTWPENGLYFSLQYSPF
jgi:hemolysin activation/secretion protein